MPNDIVSNGRKLPFEARGQTSGVEIVVPVLSSQRERAPSRTVQNVSSKLTLSAASAVLSFKPKSTPRPSFASASAASKVQ